MVSSKTPFLVRGPFCKYSILFVLILGFDGALLHGNVVVSIEVLSTKSDNPVFQSRFSFFATCFKVKALTMLIFSSEYNIKHANLIDGGLF